MSNRYALTLFHWITTIIIGSLLSGLLSQWMSSNQFLSPSVRGVFQLCVIFSGLFSLPVFLVALFFIPKLLRANFTRAQKQLFLSALSAGFVVAGFLIAGFMLDGIMQTLNEFSYVLIGFCMSAIISSFIWIQLYKQDSKKSKQELDTIDADLLN